MTKLPPNFLLINKPAGWTSFDVVGFLRKNLKKGSLHCGRDDNGQRQTSKNLKVGHAGTLDPFATGLLIVGVGREATKRLDEFKGLPKTYVAVIHLGATSDTGDSTGVLTNCHPELVSGSPKYQEMLKQVQHDTKKILNQFLGKQTQIPPMYSAKKINGQKLYKLARAGKTVERQPAPIEIYDIKLLDYAWPNLKIEVICSAGTYIRTLAEDIGKALGTGAYCQDLTRTKIGEYDLADAVTPEKAF